MLKNYIILLLILISFGNSKELNSEKFQLIAKEIITENNIVIAQGTVVVFSPTYYLSADKIKYDKEKETFELFENVLILKDNTIQTQSDYAFINLQKESYSQSPVLLFEKTNNLWVNSESSSKEKTNIELESSIISSCDCIDPAWSIRVSSASYDTKNKWMHAYNPRLYIKDIPIFYSPYIGFPTDNTRRTGLLPATLGYSSEEGIYYSQPIFYAPADNYDFEFIPQFRSKRGFGAYVYYRYKDSPYSLLQLKSGFFREDKDYQTKFELKNKKHYGANLEYERTKLISSKDTQDGLYASINVLNDIEYDTLENDEEDTSTESKIESKINYFYNTPEYYGGVYGRYYIDTSAETNDATLQKVPQLQFHSYNKEVLFPNLIYSFDTKYTKYTRKSGLTADIYEMSLPINYNKYFFDDFLYLNMGNQVLFNQFNYANGTQNFDNGTLVQNVFSLSVGTDLIKPYDNYLHTINLEANYSHPSSLKEKGDLYEITNNSSDLSDYPITQSNKNINLSLNQSLYSSDSLKQLINHKLSQSILYNEKDEAKLQNLENYVKVNYEYGSISNKLIYNVEDKQFIENSSDLTFKYEDLSFTTGYFRSKDTPNSGKEDLESFRVNTSYKFKKDYEIGYYQNYNILDSVRSKQGISLNINDRCWNLDLKYEQEITPATTTTSNDSIDQRIIYLNLELKPLGKVKQKYKVQDE
jgi:LPS-assembly protein